MKDERVKRVGKGSGSHNRSSEQNSEFGRKGGLAKVPKGFAKLTPEQRSEIARKGGQKSKKPTIKVQDSL